MRHLSRKSALLQPLALLLVAIIVALSLSCSSEPTQPGNQVSGSVNITIPKSSLVERIDVIRLQVIQNDQIVDSRETQLVNGKFDFGTFSIPTGDVIFSAQAVELPTDGGLEKVLYSNNVSVHVNDGDNVTVPLTLLPAVPMVKLTPFHDQAAVQTTYTTTLELWNISSFNHGMFRIDYDPDFFEFGGAVQANSQWGDLEILASFNTGEVILTVNRLNGLQTIPDSTELITINFNTLSLGTKTLDLSVDALSNNSGIVPEFASGLVYVDDATVDIVPNDQVGTLHGSVRNAQNNLPVVGALVTITGPVSNETTTDAMGQYQFADLPFGTYRLEVSAEGYITRASTQEINATDEQVDISLSTSLGADQYRIVLTWGAEPKDLDAHFYTLVDNIVYHVYFSDLGAQDSLPYATLDHDSTEGYGPETITVYSQVGPITFAVHNYSQFSDASAPKFAVSEAHVDLYRGNQLLQAFDVSPSATQEWWHVFDISTDGVVTVINTYSDSPPVFAFARMSDSPTKIEK